MQLPTAGLDSQSCSNRDRFSVKSQHEGDLFIGKPKYAIEGQSGHDRSMVSDRLESCSSFSSLLEQLGREHDREVTLLRLQIERLTGAGSPSFIPHATQVQKHVQVMSESEASRPLPDISSPDSLSGLCTSQVQPIIVDPEIDEEVARERDPSPDHRLISEIIPAMSSAHSSVPKDTLHSPIGERSQEMERSISDQSNLPVDIAEELAERPAARLSKHSQQSSESRLVDIEASQAMQCMKGTRSMQGWHDLITLIRAERGGTHCVQVDPIWAALRMSQGQCAESQDIRSLWTKAILGRTIQLQRHDNSDSTLGSAAKKFQKLVVFHPNSWIRVCWDLTGTFLLLHDFVMIPLQVFDIGDRGLGDSYMAFWKDLDLFASVFWTTDILVSFLTGYYSELGFVEDKLRPIARHYLKTWFPLDFLIVAVDWIGYLLNFGSEVGYLRLGKSASRFVRILRLLRFTKMNDKIAKILERINSEYVLTLVGVTKLLFGIVMVNHYIACTWYYLSQVGSEETWSKSFLKEKGEMGYAYSTSLHWSLTQFTPASMEVHATNQFERIYTIIVIIFAMVTFSSFVSRITDGMTHLRHINAKKTEKDTAFRQYFASNNISQELASQIWHFRRHNAKRIKPRAKEVDLPALVDLPDRMQALLRLEVYSPFLQRHPFFILYADICPEAMKQICHQAMGEKHVMPGEELKDLRYPTNRMLFVCSGILEYLCEEEETIKSISARIQVTMFQISGSGQNGLRNNQSVGRACARHKVTGGQWACEISLWSNMGKISGPFVGGDPGCELVFLDRSAFHFIALKHAEGAQLIAKYAKMFVQRFNSACLDPAFHNVLFNDHGTVTDILEKSTDELINNRRSRSAGPLSAQRKMNVRRSSRWKMPELNLQMHS